MSKVCKKYDFFQFHLEIKVKLFYRNDTIASRDGNGTSNLLFFCYKN